MTDEMHRLHCSEKLATFFPEEKATSLNNVIDKNRIFIVICLLLAGVHCVANKSKFDQNPIFLNGKLALLYSV